ncbi:hypothetical protein HMPREF0476_1236 [Kingella kingae ATCC 23330]|uniref:Uncharacterized protein n=1 Tax=Kingella kingae ATCC 23330 TaxID=887327 RepID=F5S7Q3_KINKI|nr:hypothetical protein HMPREF0476_1236 [Kingella kingae ATCC 23330]
MLVIKLARFYLYILFNIHMVMICLALLDRDVYYSSLSHNTFNI